MTTSSVPPPRIRGKWLLFAGVTILAAVAAGAIAVWRQHAVNPPPKPVEAPKAVAQTFSGNEVSLNGRVQAHTVVNVPVPVDGLIESLAVEIGADVFEGQLLARIRNVKLDTALEVATAEVDKTQMRVQNTEAGITAARLEASRAGADAARTRAEFDRAEKAWQRQQMLFREGATPRLTYEKAEREYNTLKEERESKDAVARQTDERVESLNRDLDAFRRTLDDRAKSLEQAKADVASADVHAPADGVVVGRRGAPGDEVNPEMQDLYRIATNLAALEVVVEPTPPQLQRIRPGQVVAIHVAEMPNEAINGTVREINGTQVIIDFTSPTALIRPGVSAQVTIKLT